MGRHSQGIEDIEIVDAIDGFSEAEVATMIAEAEAGQHWQELVESGEDFGLVGLVLELPTEVQLAIARRVAADGVSIEEVIKTALQEHFAA